MLLGFFVTGFRNKVFYLNNKMQHCIGSIFRSTADVKLKNAKT